MKNDVEPNNAEREVPRRGLLQLTFGAVSALVALVVGAPIVVAFFDPTRRKTVSTAGTEENVGNVSDMAIGQPVQRDVMARRRDAWDRSDLQKIGGVWLVRRDERAVDAYSVVCPHLGCPVGFDPEAQVFVCPCHDSAFALADGRVLRGPSPRGLDPLPVDVDEEGGVDVTYQRFVLGISKRRKA